MDYYGQNPAPPVPNQYPPPPPQPVQYAQPLPQYQVAQAAPVPATSYSTGSCASVLLSAGSAADGAACATGAAAAAAQGSAAAP